jgi:hypothetical protein
VIKIHTVYHRTRYNMQREVNTKFLLQNYSRLVVDFTSTVGVWWIYIISLSMGFRVIMEIGGCLACFGCNMHGNGVNCFFFSNTVHT